MSTLGAVLQGMDRGVMNGLKLYESVQGEARAKRQEQYQVNRDAVEDERWAKGFGLQEQEQQEKVRQFDANLAQSEKELTNLAEYRRGALSVQQQGVNNEARRIKISEATYRDGKLAEQMQRTQAYLHSQMFDPKTGEPIRDPAKLQQAFAPGTAAHAAYQDFSAYVQGDRYGKGNYSSISPVFTEKGVANVVTGEDMTGKPIKGQAPATVGGTASPDDPVEVIPLDMAILSLANPNLIAERQADALAALDKRNAAADTREYVEQGTRAAGGDAVTLKSIEEQVAAAETKLAGLTQQRASLAQAGSKSGVLEWLTTPNTSLGAAPGGVSLADQAEARRLDGEIKAEQQRATTLVDQLKGAREIGPKYMARGDDMYGQQAGAIDYGRQSLGGAGYISAAQGRPAAAAAAKNKVVDTFNDFGKTVLSNIEYPELKKADGSKGKPVSKADLDAQLRNLTLREKQVINEDPQAQAALISYLQMMATNGQKSGLHRFVDAADAGVDLDRYVELVNDPAQVDLTDDQRHQWAVQSLLKAAPDEGVSDTLARGLRGE